MSAVYSRQKMDSEPWAINKISIGVNMAPKDTCKHTHMDFCDIRHVTLADCIATIDGKVSVGMLSATFKVCWR